MMRLGKCLIVVMVALAPTMVMSASGPASMDALSVGTPSLAASAGNTNSLSITVPINMSNLKALAAVDIPLRFGQPGDGITLQAVNFNSRFSSADVKIAKIDNDNKTVIIAVIPMAFSASKREIDAGNGAIADLVFEVSDPTMASFDIEATTMNRPSHRLMWVYNEWVNGVPHVRSTTPVFDKVTVSVTAANASPVPTKYALLQNYPNPFNPSTQIAYALPTSGNVSLTIYNILGQSVNTLVNGYREAGAYQETWDGTDNHGSTVASGIYFYRIQADNFVATKKMTLLK